MNNRSLPVTVQGRIKDNPPEFLINSVHTRFLQHNIPCHGPGSPLAQFTVFSLSLDIATLL